MQGSHAALTNSPVLGLMLALRPEDHLAQANKVLTAANSRDFKGDKVEAFARCIGRAGDARRGGSGGRSRGRVGAGNPARPCQRLIQKLQAPCNTTHGPGGLTATANSEFLDRTGLSRIPAAPPSKRC